MYSLLHIYASDLDSIHVRKIGAIQIPFINIFIIIIIQPYTKALQTIHDDFNIILAPELDIIIYDDDHSTLNLKISCFFTPTTTLIPIHHSRQRIHQS